MTYTGILILNYNNIDDTIKCIKSIELYNSSAIKILIVDNGSTRRDITNSIDRYLNKTFVNDFSVLTDEEFTPFKLSKVTSLHLKKNYGYAKGNNKGLNLFYNDIDIENILIINNDIFFTSDILSPLLDKLRLHSDAIISPLLLKVDAKEVDKDCCRKEYNLLDIFIQHMFLTKNFFGVQTYLKNKNCLYNKDNKKKQRFVEVYMPSGSCMLFKKELFKSIDSFDTHTFLYYEENILARKLKKYNYRVFVDFSTQCIHVGASTVKKTTNSVFSTKCWIDSCRYYLQNYTKASNIYMKFMEIFFRVMLLKAKVATFLRRKNFYK